MKLVSIIFTASVSIVEIYLKYSEKIFKKPKYGKEKGDKGANHPFCKDLVPEGVYSDESSPCLAKSIS